MSNNNTQLAEESGDLIEDFWHGFRSDIVATRSTYHVQYCVLAARVREADPADRLLYNSFVFELEYLKKLKDLTFNIA